MSLEAAHLMDSHEFSKNRWKSSQSFGKMVGGGVGSDRERRKAACDERNSGKAELRVVVVKFGSNLNFALFVTHVTRSRPSYLTTTGCLDTPSKAQPRGRLPGIEGSLCGLRSSI